MTRRGTFGATLLVLALPTRLPISLDTPPPEPREALTTISGTIERGATLGSLLADHAGAALVHELAGAARPLYDLARLTAGRPFRITLGGDGLLRAFSYGIDELQTLRLVRKPDRLQVEIVRREYQTRVAVVAATIESSLFEAIDGAGEGDQLALELADVFAWDVDFNTEIQGGDSFRLLVEKQYLEGGFARYGRILAAELDRGGRRLSAYRHQGAAGVGYYDAEGRALRKAFLRSPLRFTRISSRFTRSRLHPILRARRPHLGVDYAAPAGTPVHAAADGLVVAAGWLGGYGKTVRLRHANGYETLYGHLSRIAVARGKRVAQGTLVGTVGATGLATGPHLDYRMWRGGRYVDPLRVAVPPAEPIPSDERAVFRQTVARLSPLLAPPPSERRASARPPASSVRG